VVLSIKDNVKLVMDEISGYCKRAGVSETEVELVAVSKTVGADKIQEAYDAGLRMFGENRVQEFVKKSEELPKEIKWNLIGQLQTNKVKYIINKGIFLLHSLDRTVLAQALQKRCEMDDMCIDVLVQVNLTKEDTKSGIGENGVGGFLEELEKLDRINVKGLMTIGPTFGNEKEIREVFARAKKIYDNMKGQLPDIKYLSMGMSHDFGWAILEGSNMVRVGTAIFGSRNYTT